MPSLPILKLWFFIIAGIALQNIKHYEPVNYNVTNVHKQHLDAVNFKNNSVTVKFSAFQR